MQVNLVSPERAVWQGEATYVGARTVAGGIGILAGHEPLLAELDAGVVTIKTEGGEDILAAVAGGFLSVTSEGVSVLAESALLAADIDVAAARRELDEVRGAEAMDEVAGRRRRAAEAQLQVAGES